MKASEFKTKTVGELVSLSETKKNELTRLRFRHSMGQLEKTADLKKLKKEIAAINTFVREKELAKVKDAKAN